MALLKLGRIEEARVMFKRLEDLMRDEGWMNNEEAIALFEEAKQLFDASDVQTEPLENTEREK